MTRVRTEDLIVCVSLIFSGLPLHLRQKKKDLCSVLIILKMCAWLKRGGTSMTFLRESHVTFA